MRKIVFLSLITVSFFQWAKAGKIDTTRVYVTNTGKTVKTKDSADFYRVILPPDTTIDKDLYRVFDYYNNGKLKRVATSLTGTGYLVLDGTCINFFPNGKRESYSQFKNGYPNGYVTVYYPNGKLYNTIKVDLNDVTNNYYDVSFTVSMQGVKTFKTEIVEERDSTGNILAAKGTGHLLFFDRGFKKIIVEGDIKKNKPEGEWKGLIADSGRFTCTFHKGDLKSGIGYLFSGKQYPFTKFATPAIFSNEPADYYAFIKKNLQYPEAEKRKIKGIVTVGFYVETTGTLSEVKVERSLIRTLDEEAVRVISLSPMWIPATKYGIPYRSHCTADVVFDNLTP